MPTSSPTGERSSYRTTPPLPLPRIPSAYAPRRSGPNEESNVLRPLRHNSFGRDSRLVLSRREENLVQLSVVPEVPQAERAGHRQGSLTLAGKSVPGNNTPQGHPRGWTPSRLPRSSSSNWRLNEPPVLRPRAQGEREKSPVRLTTVKLTPFAATESRSSERPLREGYLSPLAVEHIPISPVGPGGQRSVKPTAKPDPAIDNTNTPHRQHKRSNAVHIPRSSTDWRLHTHTTMPHPLQTLTARRPSGQGDKAECAPRRLTTTHLSPFARALPRAVTPTGARHASESSIMITQRQLLQPMGPPTPRSRTTSGLAEFTTNPRQVRHTQPSSYWSGRFTALNDRFRNEDITSAADKRMSEERRTQRIFIQLESLCVTREAKDSLSAFKSVYMLQNQHLQLSAHSQGDGDERTNILRRIIAHLKRKSGGGGSTGGDNPD